MSHKETYIQLNELGLVGIEGKNTESGYTDSNGAGKSALIEGVVWGLFGNTIRSLKDKDEVVNRLVGKNCSVELNLTHGDKFYKIVRFRKHQKSGNSLIIFQSIDGTEEMQDISRSNTSDTQLFIDQLLGLEYQSFVNAVVFGQGDIKHFSQATDAERKLMFEKLLNLEIYTRCLNLVKEKRDLLEGNIEILDRDLSYFEEKKLKLETELGDLTQKAEVYLQEAESKVKTLQESLTKYEPTDALQTSIQLEIKTLKEEADLKQKSWNEERTNLQNEINKQLMKRSALESQISERQKRQSKLSGLEGKCPTCEGQVDPERIGGIVSSIDIEIKSMSDMKQTLFKNINMLQADFDQKQDAFRKESAKLANDIELKNLKVSDLRIKENQRQNLIRQIEEAKNFKEPYTELIQKKMEEITKLVASSTDKNHLRNAKGAELEDLEFWVEGFGLKGIKSLILDDVVPFLNERLEYYTATLTNNDISISISTTSQLKSGAVSDKINLQIENRMGGSSYESNSAGERRRIDACLLFSLLDLAMQRSNPCNLLFIDEIFDVLDEVGVENLMNLLWVKIRDVGLESIMVISHNKEILRSLPATFKVVKIEGFSKIL